MFIFQVQHNLCQLASPKGQVEFLLQDLIQVSEKNFDSLFNYFELLLFMSDMNDKTIPQHYSNIMWNRNLFLNPEFKGSVVSSLVKMIDY